MASNRFYIWKAEKEMEVRPAEFIGLGSRYMSTEWVKRDVRDREIETGLLLYPDGRPVAWPSVKDMLQMRAKK